MVKKTISGYCLFKDHTQRLPTTLALESDYFFPPLPSAACFLCPPLSPLFTSLKRREGKRTKFSVVFFYLLQ